MCSANSWRPGGHVPSLGNKCQPLSCNEHPSAAFKCISARECGPERASVGVATHRSYDSGTLRPLHHPCCQFRISPALSAHVDNRSSHLQQLDRSDSSLGETNVDTSAVQRPKPSQQLRLPLKHALPTHVPTPRSWYPERRPVC